MISKLPLPFPFKALLLGFATVSAVSAQTPAFQGIDGNWLDAGSPAVTKTLLGTGFANGAVAFWDSTPLQTAFVDSRTLKATIPSSLMALSGFHTSPFGTRMDRSQVRSPWMSIR